MGTLQDRRKDVGTLWDRKDVGQKEGWGTLWDRKMAPIHYGTKRMWVGYGTERM